MRVLVKEGDALLADLTFEDEVITIGSDPGCSIHLPDARVSPRNASVTPRSNHVWVLECLDYSNSVSLNNHTVTEPKELSDGDEVVLRGYLLKVYLTATLDQGAAEVEDVKLTTEDLAKVRQFPLPSGAIVKRHFDGITMVKEQLDQASRLGVEVSTCRDIHELIDSSLNLLLQSFTARIAWIGIRRQAKGDLEVVGGRLPSGQNSGTTPIIDLLLYRCCDRNQHICLRKIPDQNEIGSAMAVPLSTRNGTFGMLYVDRPPRTKRYQIPDLDLLTAFASTVAAKLDEILQGRVAREAAVSSTEVSITHAIQNMLDPRGIPSWQNLQLAAYSCSGQEAPGDVYDVFKRSDSDISGFMLGHVRAKGAQLALNMARLQSTFRVAMLHNDAPHTFLRQLNFLAYDDKQPAIVDVACFLVDSNLGKMQYCRAGRIGVFVVGDKGEPRKLPAADGPSVGAVRNFEYASKIDQLHPGETLALYSRGVATATNHKGERFGETRFIENLCDSIGQPPNVTAHEIGQELRNFYTDGRHPDDITILLLNRAEA